VDSGYKFGVGVMPADNIIPFGEEIVMKRLIVVLCVLCSIGMAVTANGTKEESEKSSSKVNFPAKPIKIIVPFAPGGGTDITSRIFADAAGKDFFNGQPLVVENMEGGGAVIGQTYVAKTAPADGYTVMLLTSSAINNSILKKVNYSYKDFKPIIMVNPDAEIVVAPTKNAKFKTMKELIEYAKNNDVLVSTPGHSSGHHIRALNMARLMGLRFKYLHSNSAAIQVQQLMGGHCDVAFMTISESTGALSDGSAVGLGVMSTERVSTVPNVPTFKELGYDGWVDGASRGFAMRADTPENIYNYLVAEFKKVAVSKKFITKMSDAGMLYAADGPGEYQKYLDFTADAITALKDVLLGAKK